MGSKGALKRYQMVLRGIRNAKGNRCECCCGYAHYGHHIIPVSETSIASELVFDPENIMLLCDGCHALMHPLIRNIRVWMGPRKRRGLALNG